MLKPQFRKGKEDPLIVVAEEVEEIEEEVLDNVDLTVKINHNAKFLASMDMWYDSFTIDSTNFFRIHIAQPLLNNLLHLLLSIVLVPHTKVPHQEHTLLHQLL